MRRLFFDKGSGGRGDYSYTGDHKEDTEQEGVAFGEGRSGMPSPKLCRGIGVYTAHIVEEAQRYAGSLRLTGALTPWIISSTMRRNAGNEAVNQSLLLKGNCFMRPGDSRRGINIVIPMAGEGARFKAKGYSVPKPLIDVNGKPMVQVAVEGLGMAGHYIFLVRQEHLEEYGALQNALDSIAPGCTIVEVAGLTEGAACTVLLAKEHIDHDVPLMICNSDQFVDWDSQGFLTEMEQYQCDGGIATLEVKHKWSYAKTGEDGFVTAVSGKKPIDNKATVGFYYFAKGADYVRYAEQMIAKNLRVNNEFYVCPVYNEMIVDGKKIRTFDVNEMWPLGTPEDLDAYLQHCGKPRPRVSQCSGVHVQN